MSLGEAPFQLIAISAGTSEPSTTRMLADRAAQATVDRLRDTGRNAVAHVIELAPIATEIAQSLVSGYPTPAVREAIDKLATADGVIVSTPVYKAGMSGLFKSFIDLLDNDLLIAKPVLLAATAGSPRHAMVVDDHLRPLFAFLRALPAPTSLFVEPADWGASDLGKRVNRAAGELTGHPSGLAGQAHHVEHLRHHLLDHVGLFADHLQRERDVLVDRLLLQQPEVLEHAADHLPKLGDVPAGELVDVELRHPDVTRGRGVLSQQQPHERRLARTRRADQEYELTLVDLDADIVEGWSRRRLVLLTDMVKGDHHGTPV